MPYGTVATNDGTNIVVSSYFLDHVKTFIVLYWEREKAWMVLSFSSFPSNDIGPNLLPTFISEEKKL
jgi:hypothetical protein